MRSVKQKVDVTLAITTILFFITTLVAGTAAYHYRDLYTQGPRIKTIKKESVIHQVNFDPNRPQAYTCTPQTPTDAHVGMVCTSLDRNTSVNCTTTAAGNPVQYFC